MITAEDYLPISAVQHYAFCPRQFALIYMEKQWVESYLTSSGRIMHNRVHDENIFEKKGDIIVMRGLALSSESLKVFGVADIVEYHIQKEGVYLPGFKGRYAPYPVEYKRGKSKANDCDRLQLCVQCICLEEMHNIKISEAALYYGQPRRRETVSIDENLRIKAYKVCEEMHEIFESHITPPAVFFNFCKSCSVIDICQPIIIEKNSNKYWSKALSGDEV